jgi:hypothetical protein
MRGHFGLPHWRFRWPLGMRWQTEMAAAAAVVVAAVAVVADAHRLVAAEAVVAAADLRSAEMAVAVRL